MKRKLRIGGKLVTKNEPEPEKPVEYEYKVRTLLGFEVRVESPNHGRDTRDHFIDLVGNDEIEFSLWRRPVGMDSWEPLSFNVDLEEQKPLDRVVIDFEQVEQRVMAHFEGVHPVASALAAIARDYTPLPMSNIRMMYPVIARGVETLFDNLTDAIGFANRFSGATLPPRPRLLEARLVFRTYTDNFEYAQYSEQPLSGSHVYRVLTRTPAFPG